MLRTFRHTLLLCAVLLTAACSKEKTPAPRLELSAAEVVLRGGSGSEAAVTVTANGAWELTVTGSGFDITPVSGSRGETVVTLTATQENTQRTRRTLGSVIDRYFEKSCLGAVSALVEEERLSVEELRELIERIERQNIR